MEVQKVVECLEGLLNEYRAAKMPNPPLAIEAIWMPIETVESLIEALIENLKRAPSANSRENEICSRNICDYCTHSHCMSQPAWAGVCRDNGYDNFDGRKNRLAI